jgi:hypothetical protein
MVRHSRARGNPFRSSGVSPEKNGVLAFLDSRVRGNDAKDNKKYF